MFLTDVLSTNFIILTEFRLELQSFFNCSADLVLDLSQYFLFFTSEEKKFRFFYFVCLLISIIMLLN